MAKFIGMTVLLLALSLDINVQGSELGCTKEGLMPHPENCKKFVVCLSNGSGGYYADVHVCDQGQAFDAESLTCVPAENVQNCTQTYDIDLFKTDVTIPDTYTCGGFATSCFNCRVLAVCDTISGGNKVIDSFYCKDSTNNMYCNSATRACTSTAPDGCSSELKCTALGTFPVPFCCTKYQVCAAGATPTSPPISTINTCPVDQVFCSKTGACVSKTLNPCNMIKCPSSIVAYVPYPGDSRYYAVCISGLPEYVFSCPPLKNFNPAKNTCDIMCSVAGNIPDITSCTSYFYCATVSSTTSAVPKTCASGTKYDVILNSCQAVPIVTVPACP